MEGLIVVMNTEAIRPWPPGERLTIGLTLLKETQSRPRGEADAASVERRREARLRTLAVHARRRVLCKYVCGAKTRVANAVHRHEHLRPVKAKCSNLEIAVLQNWVLIGRKTVQENRHDASINRSSYQNARPTKPTRPTKQTARPTKPTRPIKPFNQAVLGS